MSRPIPEKAFQAWMRQKFENVGKDAGQSELISCPLVLNSFDPPFIDDRSEIGEFANLSHEIAGGYTITGPQDREYNCIAHAIGQKTVRLTPQTFRDLVKMYESYGFYQVDVNGPPHPGDTEVYTKPTEPGVPLHAHRIESPNAGSKVITCSSKIGNDSCISHPRDLLQCKRSTSDRPRYEYGLVQYRFRFDQAIYATAQTFRKSLSFFASFSTVFKF